MEIWNQNKKIKKFLNKFKIKNNNQKILKILNNLKNNLFSKKNN